MTDARKFLKAGEGRTVRREDTGAVWPAEGDFAALTTYVRRRLDDDDLVVATPPEAEVVDPPVPAEESDPPTSGKPSKQSK